MSSGLDPGESGDLRRLEIVDTLIFDEHRHSEHVAGSVGNGGVQIEGIDVHHLDPLSPTDEVGQDAAKGVDRSVRTRPQIHSGWCSNG